MQRHFPIFIFSAALSLSWASVGFGQSQPEAAACISQALNASPEDAQRSITLIEARAFQPSKASVEPSFRGAPDVYDFDRGRPLLTFHINDVMKILAALGGISAKDETELRTDYAARRLDQGRERAQNLMLDLIGNALTIKIGYAGPFPTLRYFSCFVGKGGSIYLRPEGGTF